MSKLRRYLPLLVDCDESVYIASDVDIEIARLEGANAQLQKTADEAIGLWSSCVTGSGQLFEEILNLQKTLKYIKNIAFPYSTHAETRDYLRGYEDALFKVRQLIPNSEQN